MTHPSLATDDVHRRSAVDNQLALEAKIREDWEPHRRSYERWHREAGDSDWSFDEFVISMVTSGVSDYHHRRARRELGEPTIWDRVTANDVEALRRLLARGPSESELHEFLKANPKFLVQVLGGGHGRYQFSKPRLGAEFVPDFLVAELDSIGIHWYAVEIESPCKKVYRRTGRPTSLVHGAIGQIQDWRGWLTTNSAYARQRRDDNGLGLVGINGRLPGLVLIGRRGAYPSRYNEFRRQTKYENQIAIHSYDWLLDIAVRNTSGDLAYELTQRETGSRLRF